MAEDMGLMPDGDMGYDEAEGMEDPTLMDAEDEPMEEAGGSAVSLTVDDMPELADLQTGDEITLKISDVSEDGTYTLTMGGAPISMEEEMPAEEDMGAPASEELGGLF